MLVGSGWFRALFWELWGRIYVQQKGVNFLISAVWPWALDGRVGAYINLSVSPDKKNSNECGYTDRLTFRPLIHYFLHEDYSFSELPWNSLWFSKLLFILTFSAKVNLIIPLLLPFITLIIILTFSLLIIYLSDSTVDYELLKEATVFYLLLYS